MSITFRCYLHIFPLKNATNYNCADLCCIKTLLIFVKKKTNCRPTDKKIDRLDV